MAKTTSKSKAKTKTTKSVSSVKTSKVTITTRQTLSLPRLQILSSIAFALSAVAAGMLMNNTSFSTTISYLTSDKLQAGAISPAYRHFFDIELRWLLVFVLGLSAVGPLLHATKMKQTFNSALKSKVMPWRWVEWAPITAFVTFIVALLAGYQDMVTLKLLAGVVLVIGLFSWFAEREANNGDKKVANRSNQIAMLLSLVLVLFIGFSLIATSVYGQVRASWYVYSAFAVLVSSLGLNSMNQFNQLRAYKNWKNYEVVERNYTLISLVSRVALAVVLIVGLQK